LFDRERESRDIGGGLSVMLVNSGWFGLGNKGDLRGLLRFHQFLI
jgi:hypothetical protein